MKRTHSFLLFIICFFILPKFTANAQNSAYSKSIDQLSMIVSGLDHWLKTPKKSPQKEKLLQLLGDSTSMKNLHKTLFLVKIAKERAWLETVIHTHQENKDRLIDELMVWRYNTETDNSTFEILEKIDNIMRTASHITTSLKHPKDYDNPETRFDCLGRYDEIKKEIDKVIPLLKEANK